MIMKIAESHFNFQTCCATLWAPTARGRLLNVTPPTSHGNCKRKDDSSTVANMRSGSKWRTLLERSSRLAGSCHRWIVQRIKLFFYTKSESQCYFSSKFGLIFFLLKLNHNLTSSTPLKRKILLPCLLYSFFTLQIFQPLWARDCLKPLKILGISLLSIFFQKVTNIKLLFCYCKDV